MKSWEKKSYKSLFDVPGIIEIVDILRLSQEVPPIVEEAIKLKNQLGNPKISGCNRES